MEVLSFAKKMRTALEEKMKRRMEPLEKNLAYYEQVVTRECANNVPVQASVTNVSEEDGGHCEAKKRRDDCLIKIKKEGELRERSGPPCSSRHDRTTGGGREHEYVIMISFMYLQIDIEHHVKINK